MKLRTMILPLVFVVIALFASDTHAQGHFLRPIRFNGPPVIPVGTDIGVTYYYEDSMTFRPISAGDQFGRMGGGRTAFPENGTAFLILGAFDSLSGSRGGISRFGLYSVDLSEFSTLYGFPKTVQFVGYRLDGSIVTTGFTTDGIIDGTGPLADFETFYFDQSFSDLVRFEVPSYGFAMDNLVFFDVIPEPASGALLLLGAGLVGRRLVSGRRQ